MSEVVSTIENVTARILDNYNSGRYITPPLFSLLETLLNKYPKELFEFYVEDYGEVYSCEDFINRLVIEKIDYITRDFDIDESIFLTTVTRYEDVKITVRYPIITISNSNGSSHIIRDLYLRYKFDGFGRLRSHLEILRGTLTDKEFISGYGHSHISNLSHSEESLKTWKIPCLGIGPLYQTTRELENSITSLDEYETLKLRYNYLFNLCDDFLSWESLEGTPYKFLEEIGKNNGLTSVALANYRYPSKIQVGRSIYNRMLLLTEDFIQELLDKYCHIKPFMVNNEFYYKIVPNNEKELMLYFTEFIDSRINYFNIYISNNNKIHPRLNKVSMFVDSHLGCVYTGNLNISNENVYDLNGLELFIFKGEKVKLNIINSNSQDIHIYTVYNPIVIYEILNTLEIILNKFYAKNNFKDA